MAEMGIGLLGRPDIIIKRKFRWMLEISTACGHYIPPHFVKTSGRPQLDLDETELHFRNAVTWIPGKGKWQPLSVTYIDVANATMQGLYDWIATLYGGFAGISANGGSAGWVTCTQAEKKDWAGAAHLMMYDGCGTPIEQWLLGSCFPQSIKWGDLDYADSAECTIELTLRFSEVEYTPACGLTMPTSCCRGCS